MDKNIFKELETTKEVPEDMKEEIISNVQAIKNGKQIPKLFNTKFYGALVNFFKLNGAK